MRARHLAIAAAAWTAANAVLYFAVIRAQGGSPAWWYVAVLAVTMTMLALAAAGRWPVPLLLASAVLLFGCALLGAASIGLLLLPGAAAAALAAIRASAGPAQAKGKGSSSARP
jgi:hypothetical protein